MTWVLKLFDDWRKSRATIIPLSMEADELNNYLSYSIMEVCTHAGRHGIPWQNCLCHYDVIFALNARKWTF